MQGFLIGDIHLGIHNLKEDKWLDISNEYFYSFFIPILEKRWKKGDKIFILGDLFDNRNYLTLSTISFALDLFTEFEKKEFDIVIISGNHDLKNNWDAEHSSLRILEKYSNVEIIKDPIIYNYANKKIGLLPWNKHSEQLKMIKLWTNKVDYLFTHSDLRGAKTGIKNVLNTGNNIADFIGMPKVYGSHIHLRQKMENFTFLGSPFHMDRNDKGNKKGLTILNFDNNTEEFIPNDISPEYKTINITKEEDIIKLENIILSEKNNFVDITINNSLVTNSKSIKRKIEELTKNNSIEKIDYIDDNVLEDGILEISLDDIGISISTEDLIKEYIVNQKDYSEEQIKKYLSILEETIKISRMKNDE